MAGGVLEQARERALVFDGAMGTLLMAAGLAPGEAPELWNEKRPEVIREIHRRYYEAGADVVHTNTFGGNPVKLADRGLAERTEALNLAAVRLAREVCPHGRFVAGDMGPTGQDAPPAGGGGRGGRGSRLPGSGARPGPGRGRSAQHRNHVQSGGGTGRPAGGESRRRTAGGGSRDLQPYQARLLHHDGRESRASAWRRSSRRGR